VSRAHWTSAFLDLPPEHLDRGTRFWAAVTGYDASAVADRDREFPPLEPPTGAAYLWVQRVDDPPSRVHLDLHVRDVDEAVERAEWLGAQLLDRREHAVLRSPEGFVFCLVAEGGGEVPEPASWPGGLRSRVDRVRLFVAASGYPREATFWETLQPAPPRSLDVVVERAAELAPRAVLEVGTDDRGGEVARHVALGATAADATAAYDELVDPVGLWYRVADRSH
jgi:hypothetical protein